MIFIASNISPKHILANCLSELLQALEHLLARELISFMDHKGHNQSIEFRPVKLLISYHELYQGLKSYRSCPVSLENCSACIMLMVLIFRAP